MLAQVARITLAVGVLVGTAVVARTVPGTWGAVGHGIRRTRVAMFGVGLAGLLSLAKVGLHEATPGPALPASARWGMVSLGAILALLWSLDRRRTRGW